MATVEHDAPVGGITGDATPGPGMVIVGRYRIDRDIGRGASGVVFAATDSADGRRVALKLLSPGARVTARARERFFREARLAAALRSEHAVRVLDVGSLETGAPFLVMELLDGEDLGALVRRRGALPVAEAVAFVREAASALAEAHASGIVHRDVKPANLFLARGRDGRAVVKVIDFGVSKLQEGVAGVASLGTTGGGDHLLGSPQYMAPEQLMSPTDVDARADVWSLGVTLYELVSGRRPFPAGSLIELSVKIFHEAPAALGAEIPASVRAVIARCLQKRREQRFENAADFSSALALAVAGDPAPIPKKRPWKLWAGAAGLLLAAGLAVAASTNSPSPGKAVVSKVTVPPAPGHPAAVFAPGATAAPVTDLNAPPPTRLPPRSTRAKSSRASRRRPLPPKRAAAAEMVERPAPVRMLNVYEERK